MSLCHVIEGQTLLLSGWVSLLPPRGDSAVHVELIVVQVVEQGQPVGVGAAQSASNLLKGQAHAAK